MKSAAFGGVNFWGPKEWEPWINLYHNLYYVINSHGVTFSVVTSKILVILLICSTSTILVTNGLNSDDVPLSNKQMYSYILAEFSYGT